MKFVCLFVVFFSSLIGKSQTIKLRPADFESGINKDSIQLLDVRRADEFNTGHLQNAMQADWTNQAEFRSRVQYLDKHRAVYVYCLVGGRSADAASWLKSEGFSQVYELSGGINAWKKADKPVVGKKQVKQLTLQEFRMMVSSDSLVLVDVGASWCPPCIKMRPVIDEIRRDTTLSFKFVDIDAGVHTDLLAALNIGPIPVFIVYQNGKEVGRKEGVVKKGELTALLRN